MARLIKSNIYLIFSVIAAIGLGYLFIESKRTFNVDESLSFALANTKGGWNWYPECFGWFTSDSFNHYMASDYVFSYEDVFLNQAGDVHPPLYYVILHTICSIKEGQFNIWFGLVINYAAYVASAVTIHLLSRRITKSEVCSALITLIYLLNTSLMAELLNMRMYELLSFEVLVLFASAYHISTDKRVKPWWYAILGVSVVCGGLTHYFFYIVMAMVSLASFIQLIVTGRWGRLMLSMLIAALCCGINYLIFPAMVTHILTSDHGTYATDLGTRFTEVDTDLLKTFMNHLWCGKCGSFALVWVCVAVSIIALVVFAFKRKLKKVYLALVALSTTAGAVIIALLSSHYSISYIHASSVLLLVTSLTTMVGLLQEVHVRKELIALVLVGILAFTGNFKFIPNNYNTEKSWEYAESNQDTFALIITDGTLEDYQINTLFADLHWYEKIGMCQLDRDLDIEMNKDFVLYKKVGIHEEDCVEYLERIGGKTVTLEKQPIKTTYFSVFKVHVAE